MAKSNIQPPAGTPGDTAHLLASAIISAIPGIGGPALEMFKAIIVPPLERRRAEWIEQLAQALDDLKDRVGRLEDLQENEAFIDAVIQASRIAVSNNQKEKVEALKNAIINSGISHEVDRSLQQIFLNYVETFSIWHLKILYLINDPPKGFGEYSMNSLGMQGSFDMVENIFPELHGKEEFFRFIWKDLYSKGLVNQENLLVTPGFMRSNVITEYGSKFVLFIMSPRKLNL